MPQVYRHSRASGESLRNGQGRGDKNFCRRRGCLGPKLAVIPVARPELINDGRECYPVLDLDLREGRELVRLAGGDAWGFG